MSQDEYVSRIRNFKNRAKDSEEMRRRRCEVSVELRKARRDDQLQKKRNIIVRNDDTEEDTSVTECSSPTKIVNPRDILRAIKTGDNYEILNAVQSARKILSRQKCPPIDMMINAGLVPVFVELLDKVQDGNDVEIQFEAAWALTNIASGNSEQTKTVIDAGAVPKFISLLCSSHPQLVEQAVWALGNITGDGPEARDLVLQYGVMRALLRLLDSSRILNHETCLRNIVWTLSNLCRHKKPPPNFEIVKEAIPYLARLLNRTDGEVLADTCWAFSYLTDGTNDKIQSVLDQNVVFRLVHLLASHNAAIVAPALRVIGNIVTGNDDQTDAVLKAHALPKLKTLLRSEKSNLVKEAAWAISNVVAGTVEQIQKVIDADILPDIINVLFRGDFRAQREAAWVVTNFTSGCSVFQLFVFLNLNVIPYYCNLLSTVDMKTICVVLDGVWNMLQMCEKIGEHTKVCTAIEECGGLDKIEELQNHQSDQVYNKAYRIIDQYFAETRHEEETPDSSIDLGNSPLTYMTPDTTSFPF